MQAIKNIDPGLKLGGPSSAQNAWIPEFLAHFEKHWPPVDFVSTHYYPTDAFGKLGADTQTRLEHAPRDVMRQRTQEAHSQARGLPLYYTEWNVNSDPRDAFARPVVRRRLRGQHRRVSRSAGVGPKSSMRSISPACRSTAASAC